MHPHASTCRAVTHSHCFAFLCRPPAESHLNGWIIIAAPFTCTPASQRSGRAHWVSWPPRWTAHTGHIRRESLECFLVGTGGHSKAGCALSVHHTARPQREALAESGLPSMHGRTDGVLGGGSQDGDGGPGAGAAGRRRRRERTRPGPRRARHGQGAPPPPPPPPTAATARAGTSRRKTPHLPLTVAGGSIGVRLRVPLTMQAQGSISSLRQLRQVLLSRSDSELAEAVRSNVWLLCGTCWSAFECGTD